MGVSITVVSNIGISTGGASTITDDDVLIYVLLSIIFDFIRYKININKKKIKKLDNNFFVLTFIYILNKY